MKRRDFLGAGAASLAVISASAASADDNPAHQKDATHEDCLKACTHCATTCDATFHHCYRMVAEGKREHAKPLHLLSDCAGFCSLSASMIAKHSPLMAYSCDACADACRITATEIEKFSEPEMKAAAKALRDCEASCTAMVKMMKDHEGHHESPAK